ncbi:MAG TPA: rubrerythrin family protein [Candidatus Pelethocola excrementipullorum]|nr:rubrerythrin family protein [Candidatus Pelethocola excrementipullorum]
MGIEFKNSETKDNLMRAFAGESQARNRYTFGASVAKKNNLYVVSEVFLFTAGQEKEHAEIFYNFLSEMAGENIHVDGSYPVDLSTDIINLLRAAQHNEYEEHDDAYKKFGDVAREEGFDKIAGAFHMIGEIEKTHGDRFGMFADMIESNALFVSDVETGWMCLNCGHIYTGKEVPERCPVCDHDRGYFIRLELSPYAK